MIDDSPREQPQSQSESRELNLSTSYINGYGAVDVGGITYEPQSLLQNRHDNETFQEKQVQEQPLNDTSAKIVNADKFDNDAYDAYDDHDDDDGELKVNRKQQRRDACINGSILLVITTFLAWQFVGIIYKGLQQDGWSYTDILWKPWIELWNAYETLLDHKPVLCKAWTSGVVYTIGDILAQGTEGHFALHKIHRGRVLRSAAAGFCLHGPLSHVWYHVSYTIFTKILQWTAWWSVIFQIAADQLIFGPLWIGLYITFLGLLQCTSIQIIACDIVRCTPQLIMSGLKLWPAAHVITYGVVPVEHRLMWVDFVEIVWVVILSSQAANRQVIDISDEEMTLLLMEDQDDFISVGGKDSAGTEGMDHRPAEHTDQDSFEQEVIILHSHVIPEHLFGDHEASSNTIHTSRRRRQSSQGRRQSLTSLLEHRRGSLLASSALLQSDLRKRSQSLTHHQEFANLPQLLSSRTSSSDHENIVFDDTIDHDHAAAVAAAAAAARQQRQSRQRRRSSALRRPVRGSFTCGQIWVM